MIILLDFVDAPLGFYIFRTTRYDEHAKAFPLKGEGFNLVNGKVNNHP